VRAAAAEAYGAGARYVDVLYTDQHVRREFVAHAALEDLGWSPPWLVERVEQLIEDGGALLSITGNPEPDLFAELEGDRVGKARMHAVAELHHRIADGACNWSIVACPNEGWARTVFGEPDLERLWAAVETAVRLDEPDPVAAWREHVRGLVSRAESLNRRELDALRFVAPGTDLTVGLLPGMPWRAGADRTHGVEFVPNMPTEEVFTSPDRRRVDGTVRATYPLHLQGTVVRGLEARFEAGEAVEVHADEGEDVVRAHVATDEGARRLGEVALVDRDSRVRKTGLVFYETLFDENATSHLAFGAAILGVLEGGTELAEEERQRGGLNVSKVHTDFMVGGDEVEIIGTTKTGTEVPIIHKGTWVV
jgi:aminopeptidase